MDIDAGIPELKKQVVPGSLVRAARKRNTVPGKSWTSAYTNEHHKSMTPVTPALINKLNSDFWDTQVILMNKRIGAVAIPQVAIDLLNWELSERLPPRQQHTFEELLAKAEEVTNIVLTERARKAGKTPRPDTLQELIVKLVREHPEISEKELLEMLAGEAGAGVVDSIDKRCLLACDIPCIRFTHDDGRPDTAPVRALKDRLYRAKKQINISR